MSNQMVNENENGAEEVPKNGSWWWWQPDPDSPLIQALKRTKLDGLKEALRPNIHILQRIFWIFVTFMLLWYGVYLCKDGVDEFIDHDIRYDKFEGTPLSYAPWASAIICPRFMLSKAKLKEIKMLNFKSKNMENETQIEYKGDSWKKDEVQALVTFANLACDAGDIFLRKGGIKLDEYFSSLKLDNPINISDNPHDKIMKEKIVPFFQKGLVHCDQLVKLCSWNGKVSKNCSGILRPVQTDVGTCCGFNSIPDDILTRKPSLRSLMNDATNKTKEEDVQWRKYNLDNDAFLFQKSGWKTESSVEIPKRQKAAGRAFGLSLVIGVHDDEEEAICPVADGEGMLMAIVDPMDEPQMLKKGFYLKPNHETFVQITSKFTKASENMHGMKVDVRKCYFSNETILEHYAKYTESNCQLECQAEVIEGHCNCIPIDLSYGNNSTICGPEKKECISDAKLKLINAGYEKLTVCKSKKCYRSCNQIEYKETFSSSPLPKRSIEEAKNTFDFSPEVNLYVVHAFQVEGSIPTEIGTEHFSYMGLILLIFGIMGFTSGMTGLTPFRLLHAVGYYVLCKLKKYSWFQTCYTLLCIRSVDRENEQVTEVESVVDENNQNENGAGGENEDATSIIPASEDQSENESESTGSNVIDTVFDDQEKNEDEHTSEDADSGVPTSDEQNEDKDENGRTSRAGSDEDNEGDGESTDLCAGISDELNEGESKDSDPVDDQIENEQTGYKNMEEIALDGDQSENGEEETNSNSVELDDHKETDGKNLDLNAALSFVPENNAQSENVAEGKSETGDDDKQNQDGYVEFKFKHVRLDLSPESQRRLQIFDKFSADSSYSVLVGPNPKSPTSKASPSSTPSQHQDAPSLVATPPANFKNQKPVIEDNNEILQMSVLPKSDPSPPAKEKDQSPTSILSSEIENSKSFKEEEIADPSFHVSRFGPKMSRPSTSFSRHVTKDDMELTEVVVEPRYKRPTTAPSSFEVRVPNPNPQVQPLPDIEEIEDNEPWTAERILKLWKS